MKTRVTKKDLPQIQMTQEGYNKFKAEFDRLTQQRPEVLARLQTAREMGDLSENGAYHAAKFELGNIDRQLRKLSHQLRFAKIITPKHNGIIEFGSTVKIDNNGKIMQFTLVSGYESNPAEHKLSIQSPIGKAIMGKKVGDSVKAETPAGTLALKILSIE